MSAPKDILLISYVFPPYPGIGGRRWAKFARELANAGHRVHVICAENPGNEISLWQNDVQHKNIFVHPLPARYPHILLTQPRTILQKLRYRYWRAVFTRRSKGVIYERTLLWKKQLSEKANAIIFAHPVSTIIVTGPPFHLLHHALAIKAQHPQIKLITDLRDPWTDNQSFMGFKDMEASRRAYEEALERDVYQQSDLILTVSDHMSDLVRRKIPGQGEKVHTLINGYDPQEVHIVATEASTGKKEKLDFVYAGSLYPNLEYIFIPFADYLVKLREQKPEQYKKLSFRFFGNAAVEMKRLIEARKLSDVVQFNGWIPRAQLNTELSKADGCLLFFAPDHAFSMNTKLFEYLAHRKPVVLFSNPGETPDFLVRHQLGAVITPENFDATLNELLNKFFQGQISINRDFDLTRFSIPEIAKELLGLIH